MPLLIHGIIEADQRDPVSLAADDEVEGVGHGRLAAIVRPTPDAEVLPSRANLLAHTRVLEALATETTVLPMRFGMVADDGPSLIEEFLAPQEGELLAAIHRLHGHVELRLRGQYDEDAVVREVLAADPDAARLRRRTGTDAKMQLGERIVAGIDARRQRDVDLVVASLTPYVRGIVANGIAEPLDAFSLSLLVPRDGMEGFDDAVDGLGQELAPALALELIGPVPPFSFAVSEGAAA